MTKLVSFFTIQLLFLLLINSILTREQTIHSWDDTVQHNNFIYLNSLPRNFSIFYTETIHSIANSDYNFLSTLPLVLLDPDPDNHSRRHFILLIYFIYLLPCFLIFRHVALKVFSQTESVFDFILLNLLFFLNPIILINLIHGQTPLASLGLISLCYLLIIHNSSIHRIYLGLIIGLLPILHRWYAFFSVAFLLILTINYLLQKKFKNILTTVIISAATFTIISGTSLWQKYLFINYHQKFLAFKSEPDILKAIWQTVANTGLIYLILFCYSIYRLPKKFRYKYLYLSVPIFIIVLFLRIQSFADHHYLLIFIPIFLPIANLLFKSSIPQKILFAVFIMIISLNSLSIIKIPYKHVLPIFPKLTYKSPAQNIELISQISNYLNSLTDIKSVYFISRDWNYNSTTIFYFACILQQPTLTSLCPDKITRVSSIVTTDAFPQDFITSNYVILDPVSAPTNPATAIFQNFIQNNPNLYQLLSESFTDNHIKLLIYRQIRSLSDSEINTLQNQYLLAANP